MHLLFVLVVLDEAPIQIEVVQELLAALDRVLVVGVELQILLQLSYDFRPDLLPPFLELPPRDLHLLGLEQFADDLRGYIGEWILRKYFVNSLEVRSFEDLVFQHVDDQEGDSYCNLLPLQQKARKNEYLHF